VVLFDIERISIPQTLAAGPQRTFLLGRVIVDIVQGCGETHAFNPATRPLPFLPPLLNRGAGLSSNFHVIRGDSIVILFKLKILSSLL
jgi:hypothetical protein